jgi:hypothetical protein
MPGQVGTRAWLLVGALLGACADSDEASGDNPSFDDWCDDHLCAWQTVTGRVAPTGTWHRQDLAAEFLDSPTEITQVIAPKLPSPPCLQFDTIADVGPEAFMSLKVDFNDDGSWEVEQQITDLSWQSVPFTVRAPGLYLKLRVSVIKEGRGRAVLAQLRMVPRSYCVGAPLNLKDGSACSQDAVCASGHCLEGYCQSCDGDACMSLTPAPRSE